MGANSGDWSQLWGTIKDELKRWGCDFEGFSSGEGPPSRMKVVCVAPDLRESSQEMGQKPRDRVVMVRLDKETAEQLDAWVETGVAGSRSEAAALFIREGLKVRAGEFEQLSSAVDGVASAKQELRRRASQVFGASSTAESAEQGEQS